MSHAKLFLSDVSVVVFPEEEAGMCVRDRALLYYRLLQSGVDETRKVLLGPKSDPSMTVLTGRPEEPVNHWASSFNTLAPLCGTETYLDSISAEEFVQQLHKAEENEGAEEIKFTPPEETLREGNVLVNEGQWY